MIFEGYREGASVRMIADAAGISKSTLYEWITGPLQEELERAVADSRRRGIGDSIRNDSKKHRVREGRFTEIDGKNAVPSEVEGQEIIEQDRHEDDQGSHLDERDGYRPDLPLGSVRDSSRDIPDTEIRCSVSGTPICSRCGQNLDGSARDATFVHDADGLHRPCHPACLREGEHGTGWPAMPGERLKPPGYRIPR
jgi:transposase-like protein